MQMRHIEIKNFRGIKSCVWTPKGQFLCLVGHGDSTKSTLLDAIELTLCPRTYLQIGDADFHALDTSQPILIEATVGELPEALIALDEKFGRYLRGWNPGTNEIVDEPTDHTEDVLTIRFTVDESFEPSWTVVCDRFPEGKPLSARNRDLLGVVRITADVNRHLTWAQGSALTWATETREGTRRALALAQQSARLQIEQADLSHLKQAAKKAETAAKSAGAIVRNEYLPSLYMQHWGAQYGALGLSDGKVPLLAAGLGTRRLVAFGLQSLAIAEGSIVLIDEIEHGLEPHRLRHLIRTLRPANGKGQVFFTTHSAVTLIELQATDIHFVTSPAAATCVAAVPAELQALVRAMPEALLGKRVLVTEGRTELGLIRGLEDVWRREQRDLPLTHCGGVAVDGRGDTQAKQWAAELSGLSLPIALLVDSDNPGLQVDSAWQRQSGVKVFSWEGSVSTEQRISLDLPWENFKQLVQFVAGDFGEESVCAKLSDALHGAPRLSTVNPEDWIALGVSSAEARATFGTVAKKQDWLKSIDRGEHVGALLASCYGDIQATPLGQTLAKVAAWLYE